MKRRSRSSSPSRWRSARCSPARRARARPTSPSVTKPPKLVKFVEAVYPEGQARRRHHRVGAAVDRDRRRRQGRRRRASSRAAAPDFDAAAVAAAKQFVFEPAEIDGQPAPVKITYRYDFTIKEKMVKLGPQINFDGVVLERFKKKPIARRQGRDQGPRRRRRRDRRGRPLRVHRRAAGHAQGRALAPEARSPSRPRRRSPRASGAP